MHVQKMYKILYIGVFIKSVHVTIIFDIFSIHTARPVESLPRSCHTCTCKFEISSQKFYFFSFFTFRNHKELAKFWMLRASLGWNAMNIQQLEISLSQFRQLRAFNLKLNWYLGALSIKAFKAGSLILKQEKKN